MIRIENGHIGVNKVLVKNINVQADGKLIGLAGRNGSGKSTLLRTIAGLIPQKQGEFQLQNKSISDYSRRALAKILAVSFASSNVYGNATFRDIVELGRLPHLGLLGRLDPSDHELVEKEMVNLGIETMSNKQFKESSDGERQKCLLARCFAQQTPILLLDEPTAFLDFPSRVELYRLLQKKCKDDQKTIIVSSHDLNMLEEYSDEIWLIQNDSLFKSTDPDFKNQWFEFKSVSHEKIA